MTNKGNDFASRSRFSFDTPLLPPCCADERETDFFHSIGIKRGRYSYQKKASLQKRNANTKENIPSHCAVTPADSMRDKPYLKLSESQGEYNSDSRFRQDQDNCVFRFQHKSDISVQN